MARRGGQLALASAVGFRRTHGMQFGQQTGFINGALEAADRNFERLIFLQANGGH
jgi:hypothetical protein